MLVRQYVRQSHAALRNAGHPGCLPRKRESPVRSITTVSNDKLCFRACG
jgi:hypothetical protein